MKLLTGEHSHTCTKKCKESSFYGLTGLSWICGEPAKYYDGNGYYCRHHSRMQRYVVRDGDVGEILARFDTEKELRDNIHLFPGMRMQKLTKSHRRDIF